MPDLKNSSLSDIQLYIFYWKLKKPHFAQELCGTHFSTSSSISFLDNDLHLGDAFGGGEYSLFSDITVGVFFVVFFWSLPNFWKEILRLQVEL